MTSIWVPAYVALGSNLDAPLERVNEAFERLALLSECRLIARSRLYRSTPLGPTEQPDFINAVAGLITTLAPLDLLVSLQSVQNAMGKVPPPVRWGPRRIDLDLLVYGTERMSTPALTIPHPGVPERNFVLYPLLDIAPTLVVPGLGRVRALAERSGMAGLTPLSSQQPSAFH
jgi:2-amino-4-hydroxy-6-hydroxymethyldihydropteridine diphosphokinase